MDNQSLKDQIKIDHVNCIEWPIEGLVTYATRGALQLGFTSSITGYSSNRLEYFIPSSLFYNVYPENGNVILVFDPLNGTQKKLLPKHPDQVIKIHRYSHLSLTRGLMSYKVQNTMPQYSQRVSVVSIDFENCLYEIIGDSFEVSTYTIRSYFSLRTTNPTIVLQFFCEIEKKKVIHIIELSPASFLIKSYKKMRIPEYAVLFGSINEKLIYTTIKSGSKDYYALDNFTMIEKDDSLVEIDGTDVRANIRGYEKYRWASIVPNLQASWHGTKAFVFNSHLKFEYYERLSMTYPLESSPSILTFEFETKSWSEILLPLPSNRIYYQFKVDDDFTLNVITYSKDEGPLETNFKLRAASIRVPLKKPDKLCNLCWFVLRYYKLADKFHNLNNLI